MIENRLTERLVSFYTLIKKEKPFPDYARFNHTMIEDIWHQCFVVSVDTNYGIKCKYLYMGNSVVEAYGQNLTGVGVDPGAKKFPGAVTYKNMVTAVEKKSAYQDHGSFVNKNSEMIKYRACFLPFGNEKKGITHIIVGLSYRVFK